MAYKHKLDPTGEDFFKGGRAEEKFKALVIAKWGQKVIEDTDREEDFQHADYKLHCRSGIKTVDVKASKFLNNQPCFVVELMCNGGLGWLYGRQDYVALNTPDGNGFVVVSMPKLREWVRNNLKADITTVKRESFGRIYAREKERRRNDLTAMLPWSVALELKEWEL